MNDNIISQRLAALRAGSDPTFLTELPSGIAVLGPVQPKALPGSCMLIPDPVVASPNELAPTARGRFFADMVLLGDAILQVTGAQRINYLVLCNQAPELHGHCIPRFATEAPELRLQGPFEAYDFSAEPSADPLGIHRAIHADLKEALQRLQSEHRETR